MGKNIGMKGIFLSFFSFPLFINLWYCNNKQSDEKSWKNMLMFYFHNLKNKQSDGVFSNGTGVRMKELGVRVKTKKF